MAVTFKNEEAEGRTAENNLGVRTYSRRFRLTTDARTDGAYAVGSHASLPKIGDVYPDDSSAWCHRLRVENTEAWRGWKVTADYSSARELNNDPTLDPAFITWDSEQFQKPAEEDKDGNGVCNSAGQLFDPPSMMDDSRRVVTVQKNLTAVPSWILDYQDAVNNDAFTVDGVSIAIGKAKMQRVAVGAEDIRNGTTFRPVTFTLHLRRDGWAIRPMDVGFFNKQSGDTTKRESSPLDDGTESPVPVFLDGSGGILANPSTSNAVFLAFDVYEQRAFTSLPLT